MGWKYDVRHTALRAAEVELMAKRHRAERESCVLAHSVNSSDDWYWSERRCAQRAAHEERKAIRIRQRVDGRVAKAGYPWHWTYERTRVKGCGCKYHHKGPRMKAASKEHHLCAMLLSSSARSPDVDGQLLCARGASKVQCAEP